MAKSGKTTPKLALSTSRDIPFDKLVLSQANVRRVQAGVSIEQLAEDIARRTLLQSLTVRPVLDGDGQETGMYEIPAGGRRYRALELLVRQKRLPRTAPVPCVVRTDGVAEEDSLAENVQRAPLHPLDQFRAFLALRERGQSEEEVAAAFFVTAAVVRQRLRLASVSPRLLELYAEDAMTLEQLMAFTVSGDWERQEQVWERLRASYSREPYQIRRMLTEGAVRASDKRAGFVGLDAYEAAGGAVLRDLFAGDDGGWLQDVALVDRLVAERLAREAEAVRDEGWRWVEAAPDMPYGHTFGLRRLRGEAVQPRAEEQAARAALEAEYAELEEAHAQASELPEDVDLRLGEIEAALAALDERAVAFDPDDVSRAGAFVSIDGEGRLRVERGYVRPEDELPVAPEPEPEPAPLVEADVAGQDGTPDAAPTAADRAEAGYDAHPAAYAPLPEPEEDEGMKPLPDRLLTELSAYRTLALRDALGTVPHLALLAALHALCLKAFYQYGQDTCLELDLKSAGFAAQAPGLRDSLPAQAMEARHQHWQARLPRDPAALWDALDDLDGEGRLGLFAHVVALSVNAVSESWSRRPRAMAHADRLAQALEVDVAATGWVPTVDGFLGRVTKARILGAVQEARGEQAMRAIEGLRKPEMAQQAEALLAGTGWLPEPLRTPGRPVVTTAVLDAEDVPPEPLSDQAEAGAEDASDSEPELPDGGDGSDEQWAQAAE